MSGWYKRLNSTSPSTSAACSAESEMAERGEPRPELDRQRHRHFGTHVLDQLEVSLLDVGRTATRVDDDVVHVQFDGLCSCALEMAGVLHPPARRRSVETGDHRDRQLGRGPSRPVRGAERGRRRSRRARAGSSALRQTSRHRGRLSSRRQTTPARSAPRRARAERSPRPRPLPISAQRRGSPVNGLAEATIGLRSRSPR